MRVRAAPCIQPNPGLGRAGAAATACGRLLRGAAGLRSGLSPRHQRAGPGRRLCHRVHRHDCLDQSDLADGEELRPAGAAGSARVAERGGAGHHELLAGGRRPAGARAAGVAVAVIPDQGRMGLAGALRGESRRPTGAKHRGGLRPCGSEALDAVCGRAERQSRV